MGIFNFFKSPDERAQALVDSVEVGPSDWRLVDSNWTDPNAGIESSSTSAVMVVNPYTEQGLSDLYDYDWLPRKIVRCLPETAWQDELVFSREADREYWEELNYTEGDDDGAFLRADMMSRLHGAALLIKGYRFSGAPESPAPEGKSPEFLEVVRSEEYHVTTGDLFDDPTDAVNYGRPEYYSIQGDHRWSGLRVHHSRVIHFPGPTPADPLHSRDRYALKNMSVLDPVTAIIQDYGLSWSSVNGMLKQASVPIWQFPNLIQALAQNRDDVLARHKLMNAGLSSHKSILLDKDESYRREAVGFGDVPQILQQISLQVAAASDIPVSKLFGRIISGLGDTGETEDKQWIRQVESYRKRKLAPRITAILGKDVDWDFKPLNVPTAKEKAEGAKAWWDMGAVLDEEIRKLAEDALTLPELTPEQLAEQEAEKQRALEMQQLAAQSAQEGANGSEEETTTGENETDRDPDEEQGSPDNEG